MIISVLVETLGILVTQVIGIHVWIIGKRVKQLPNIVKLTNLMLVISLAIKFT